jgi:regulator of cell morphogenesis and NO signaling
MLKRPCKQAKTRYGRGESDRTLESAGCAMEKRDEGTCVGMTGESMSEQNTITAFYAEDHDRLDELFKTFQTSKRTDFAKAKDAFKEFKVGLQRHIVWEEELLFPMWEEKTGMIEDGPTPVMRFEHEQIKKLLEAIHQKVEEQNLGTDQDEQALLNLLGSHNRKEEKALYPAIDNVTNADERTTIFNRMKTIPEDQYNACCGDH